MKKKNSKNYYNVWMYGKGTGYEPYTVWKPFKQAVKIAKTESLRDPENIYCVAEIMSRPGSVYSEERGHYVPEDFNCPIYVKGQRVQPARNKKPNVGKGR